MQVGSLYIFGAVGHDDMLDGEVKGGCQALAEKSLAKCGSVVMCFTNGAPVRMDGSGRGKRKVGAYLICHADKGEPIWDGAQLRTAIPLMQKVMGNDFPLLEKLAILACGAAPQESKSKLMKASPNLAAGEVAFGNIKRQGLLQLIAELRVKGCSPLVAGYDDFVSIAYADDKFEKPLTIRSGQKFVTVKKGYGSRKGDRKTEKHKRFFFIDNAGKLQVTDEARWSDK